MPNLTRFIILAATLATACGPGGASTLGHTNDTSSDSGIDSFDIQEHRHLLEDDAECVLYLQIMDFKDSTPAKRTWYCKFEHDDALRQHVPFMPIEGVSSTTIDSYGAVSGEAIMKIKGAYILRSIKNSMSTLVVPDGASFTIEKLMEEDRRHHKQRQGLGNRIVGTRRTLVVRVIDNKGNALEASKDELYGNVFNDAACLKSQFAACSFNQLMFEPSEEGGGAIEMTVSSPVDESDAADSLTMLSMTTLGELYGGEDGIAEKFDHVLFCWPDGYIPYSFAGVNTWYSIYNADGCSHLSTLMHEIGHNLGFSHSGRGDEEYGDLSGYMGYGHPGDDGPLMCFNPVKNWALGWYKQQELELDPLSIIGNPRTYVLNGIVDYQPAGSVEGKIVVFRIIEYGNDIEAGNDYYIGFNRASGFNAETQAAPDQVVILKKEKGGPYDVIGTGQELSFRIKDLTVGETYAIPNFKGGIYTVYIKWVSLSSDGKDATIQVYTSEPVPTSAPTTQCGSDATYQFKIFTDEFAEGGETGWVLRKKDDQSVIASKSDFSAYTSYVLPTASQYYCLEVGCYENIITDTHGDGVISPGTFSGHLNGVEIFGYETFTSELTKEFCVTGAVTNPPTRAPTQAPVTSTPEPTNPPTRAPTQAPVTSTPEPTNPPTRAPTKSPTQAPVTSTLEPTFEPTFAPTFAPTFSTTFSCEDDASFKFNGSKKKTCKKWVGKGKNKLNKKTKKKIKKKCKKKVKEFEGKRVYDFCRDTCSLVNLGPCA